MKILLTNDDGIHAPGLWALRDAVAPLGEVFVVAPDRPRSAMGHAITLHKPLRITKVTLANGSWGWCTNGTPSDCVVLAIADLVGKCDLVISGINVGANLGEDLTYSGTVSAAMEGVLFGVPSFSISIAADQVDDFGPAARFAPSLAKEIGARGLPPGTFLNVNVPPGECRGVAITRQGRRRYSARLDKRFDPRGEAYYWLTGSLDDQSQEQDSDVEAVARGMISITPIHLDLTDHSFVETLRTWALDPAAE